MQFGVFDHMDSNGLPLQDYYEQRLKLIEAYDRAGFFGYHLAEHHATPLGLGSSPSVFLSAVAQRTHSLRFGPMVYTLPLYHPIRLIEEICMLDHMSGGRYLVGVGRGISPIENKYYGLVPEQAEAMFHEALEVLLKGLTEDTLTYHGKYYQYESVPMILKPVQRPTPPLWYGAVNPESAKRLARQGMNMMSNVTVDQMRGLSVAFRQSWAEQGRSAGELPMIGMNRHLVIADTDAKALEIARRAYKKWLSSFMYLWNLHGQKPKVGGYPEDFDGLVAEGRGIAGSPETVLKLLSEQVAGSEISYFVGRFCFGDMTTAEALRSLDLFSRFIMPALQEQSRQAA